MRRIPVVVTIALLAGFVIGYFTRSAAGTFPQMTNAADLAAIEKLNQADIDATLAQDSKRLIELWADDAVAFFPGRPAAVGKEAIRAIYAQSPAMKVASYTSTYKNLQVEGGLAGEWFEKKAEYKVSPDSPAISWHAFGLLVLKRQSDGSWKAVMSFPIS